LVDLNGNLVGINTAIASKTGSYIGYGFAIPSRIVAKIIKDLKEYGAVQRAFTGLTVQDIEGKLLDKYANQETGVYVLMFQKAVRMRKILRTIRYYFEN